MWKKRSLYFQDIALLWLIHRYWRDTGRAPTVVELRRDWPLWAEESGAAAAGYTKPVYSGNSYSAAIAALRGLGLLENERNYRLSAKGEAVVRKLTDDWRRWPLEVAIEDNTLKWEKAIYME